MCKQVRRKKYMNQMTEGGMAEYYLFQIGGCHSFPNGSEDGFDAETSREAENAGTDGRQSHLE
jgi:hypothetical protein